MIPQPTCTTTQLASNMKHTKKKTITYLFLTLKDLEMLTMMTKITTKKQIKTEKKSAINPTPFWTFIAGLKILPVMLQFA